jgi:hypothetical protein
MTTGSHNKSIPAQKALLKARGLEEEFPDALMVLTIAVLTRILTRGGESSYGRFETHGTYTRTNKKTPEGWTLCGGSAPSCVFVSDSDPFQCNNIGVGGLREFV